MSEKIIVNTEYIIAQNNHFEELIDEMHNDLSNKNNVEEIIEYLNKIVKLMSFGHHLMRFICRKYGKKGKDSSGKIIYTFKDSLDSELKVEDFENDGYDPAAELDKYVDLFTLINQKYNCDENGNLLLYLSKEAKNSEHRKEIRRLLGDGTSKKPDYTPCGRKKMFTIGFALHMNKDEMNEFLTKVLAEQTYSMRSPYEIIAFYCQMREETNSYAKYLELVKDFDKKKKSFKADAGSSETEGFTRYAYSRITRTIDTDDELMMFLLRNINNFDRYSYTAYSSFTSLLKEAKNITMVQRYKNTFEIGDSPAKNNEELAREMIKFVEQVPKVVTMKSKDKDGNTGTRKANTEDFVSIKNGKRGDVSEKENEKITTLNKEVTKNLPFAGRLNDISKRKKPAERKDLIFLYFYISCKKLEKYGGFDDRLNFASVFIDECNNLLVSCGMSRLYAGNTFDNLIMLSLYGMKPYKTFSEIFELSFND